MLDAFAPEHSVNSKAATEIFSSISSFAGYYQVPEHSTIKLSPAVTQLQLTSSSQAGLPSRTPNLNKGGLVPPLFPPTGGDRNLATAHDEASEAGTDHRLPQTQGSQGRDGGYAVSPRNDSKMPRVARPQQQLGYDPQVLQHGLDQLLALNTSFLFSARELSAFGGEAAAAAKAWVMSIENKELKVISVTLLLILSVLVFNALGGGGGRGTGRGDAPSHGSYRMSQGRRIECYHGIEEE